MTGFASKRQSAWDKFAKPWNGIAGWEEMEKNMKTEEDDEFARIEMEQRMRETLAQPAQEHAEQLAKFGWQYFACPACGSEGAQAFPKPVAQPAQEPFGYFRAEPFGPFGWTDCAKTDEGAVALYEAPPQRPWAGLTDKERFEIGKKLGLADVAWLDLMQAIEAALRSKNT